MHLLCLDTDCLGNDLPAGTFSDTSCRYCGADLTDEKGNVLAQGAAPLVEGEPPSSFDALMDALRNAGSEVQVVELTAVRCGDRLLYSTVTDNGEVLAAGVTDGQAAESLAGIMGTLDEDVSS